MEEAASQPTTVVKDAASASACRSIGEKRKSRGRFIPTDASNLKKYSVVIASLSVKLNAESLKSRMEAEGYPVILAQNEHGNVSGNRSKVMTTKNRQLAKRERNFP